MSGSFFFMSNVYISYNKNKVYIGYTQMYEGLKTDQIKDSVNTFIDYKQKFCANRKTGNNLSD